MKRRLWRLSVFLVLLAGFAALSIAAPQVQKHKITLENGKIIEGEIVAVTATTISIKDAALGVIAIARENILKIEPPLDEAKPAVAPATPAPRYADQPVAPRNGAGNITFGFSLSGGLSNINGGDFNQMIRDYNTWGLDYNDYWGDNYYSVDWQEMKWLPKFGGEFLVRFGKNFGVGLGVEYLKKTNIGHMDYVYEDTWSLNYFGVGYIVYDDNYYSYNTITQSLSVIPITLSFYGYLPLGPQAEAYVKAGAGYYLGKLTSNWLDEYNGYYNENWYWNSGAPWPPHYHEVLEGTYTENFEATCNTMGFHFGAGFNFNITNNIALFGEAFYRMVSFKDWQGSGGWENSGQFKWGDTTKTSLDDLPNAISFSDDDSYNGKFWSFNDIWPGFDTESYLRYWAYEAGDEPDENAWTEDVRPTEINLNGFNFKVGVKIFFGGRR